MFDLIYRGKVQKVGYDNSYYGMYSHIDMCDIEQYVEIFLKKKCKTDFFINSSEVCILINNSSYRMKDIIHTSTIIINFISGKIEHNLDIYPDEKLLSCYNNIKNYNIKKLTKLFKNIKDNCDSIFQENKKFLMKNIKLGVKFKIDNRTLKVISIVRDVVLIDEDGDILEYTEKEIVEAYMYKTITFDNNYLIKIKLKNL